MKFVIVDQYKPVEQLSKEDLSNIVHAGDEFGVRMPQELALQLIDESLYHKIRMYGSSDTEVREDLYEKFIIEMTGNFNRFKHTHEYDSYSDFIRRAALAKGCKEIE